MAQYVLRPEVVEGCMLYLAGETIHRHFAGYLGMKRTAEVEGQTEDVFFDYDGFFNAFFRVRDDEAPYLVPFDTAEMDDRNYFWFNQNVAGSYSTSSIRDDKPFAQCVDYGGSYSDRWWTLKQDHHEIAFEEMLEAEVPVEPLAVFLYRDFAIELEDEPSIDHFVQVFRDEFGYSEDDDEQATEYDTLFRTVEFDYDNPFEAAQHG